MNAIRCGSCSFSNKFSLIKTFSTMIFLYHSIKRIINKSGYNY